MSDGTPKGSVPGPFWRSFLGGDFSVNHPQGMPMPTTPTPPSLSGVWVPLITPFDNTDEQAVDHNSLNRLTAHLASQGVHGLVVGGTTAEAAALTPGERLACWRTVAHSAPGVPLMLGTGGASLAEALHDMAWLGQQRQDHGLPLHSVLLAAPAYIRPSAHGLLNWFHTLADAAPAPVVIYDIPYRTGSVLARDTLLQLADHPNIIGIKDCGGDAAKTLALLHDGRLHIMAGEDLQVMAHLAHGGAGCISASAHLFPERWVGLFKHMQHSHLPAAQALWRSLVPLIDNAFSEPNPGPIKAALAIQGWIDSDAVRSPMTVAGDAVKARWKALGLSPR
jgi:4-hydroxy-tetrahydrodipicolinate synthase